MQVDKHGEVREIFAGFKKMELESVQRLYVKYSGTFGRKRTREGEDRSKWVNEQKYLICWSVKCM